MHQRAETIARQLALLPHPEGGRYRRLHAADLSVVRGSDGATRPALTTIAYLLVAGEQSAWHQVQSEEVWHFYEGAPLRLQVARPDGTAIQTLVLGPMTADTLPVHVVPAGWWQRAQTLGPFSLVGCTVAPGFAFADFRLARDLPPAEQALRERLLGYDQP